MSAKRFGFRWTINECLQLEREFELLGLSIDEIAQRHQRTPNAIMFKLDEEKLSDYTTLYNKYYNMNIAAIPINFDVTKNQDQDEDECYECEVDEDDSSDYSEDSNESEEEEEEDEREEEEDLRSHVRRLEKKLNDLTQLLVNQNKSTRGMFSLFA